MFTSELGASFVDLHVRQILPGQTAVVSHSDNHLHKQIFPASCPVLQLGIWSQQLHVRLAVRAGRSLERQREAAVGRFLRRNRTEVVLGEYLDQFLDFVPLMKKMGLPFVVQGHGIDVSARLREPGMGERYRVAYSSAKAVLTRCEPHRQRLIALGLPAEKIHVNHGGVAVPQTLPVKNMGAGKRLLAVGVMVPKKAPIFLLEAFRRAALADAELTLDYVGGGPLLPAARQFVEACGLAGRVRLHGVAPEALKLQLLAECGVFVQHSMTTSDTGDEEGLPAAIQEAMAAGMAVVSTRHSGIPEAVLEGETGLLVEEGDVEGMAEAFLAVGPQAARMGRVGYHQALAQHAWPQERARLRHWLFEAA